MTDVLLPHLNGMRDLTRFLVLAAVCQHQSGDDRMAVDTLRDALSIGPAIDRQSFLVPHLVAIGVTALTCQPILDIAQTLRVQRDDGTEDGAATREQIQSLIADLLDETIRRRGIESCWQGETMRSLDLLQTTAANANPLVAYQFRRQAPALVRAHDAALDASLQPNWRAAKAKLAQPGSSRNPIAGVVELLWPREESLKQEYRLLTERRAAAVALAVALYRADHEGRSPARMEDLVPTYLPAAPADPFAEDRSPLKLVVRGDAGPLVYSVAENGTDDGGDETLLPRPAHWRPGFPAKVAPDARPQPAPRNVVDIVGYWNSPDAVYHLAGRTRSPEPEESRGVRSPPGEHFRHGALRRSASRGPAAGVMERPRRVCAGPVRLSA